MYPSDYGYATSGGSTTDRATCLAKEMYNWDISDVSDCKSNDYLYKSDYHQWTLTPYTEHPFTIFDVPSRGHVYYGYTDDNIHSVRPALYLNSSALISRGDGSSTTPYNLKIN